MTPPFPISGYVLAGGKSSRMGHDKALLELAGRPLVAHAVTKLRRLCADVAILSANPALAPFAALVPDLHPGCGPLGGIEAALAHTTRDWCLILPVDVPFLPSTLLGPWIHATLSDAQSNGTRVAFFVVDGQAHPALLLIHRDFAPYISAAITRDDLKLLRVLSAAADDLASRHDLLPSNVLRESRWTSESSLTDDAEADALTQDSRIPLSSTLGDIRHLYFANLNTPEDFAEATRHIACLDT